MAMETRPFGRDWGLSVRMALCLCLLALLYLPFLLWIVGFAYFIWGVSGAILSAVVALGLLAAAPYLSELLALRTARVEHDHPAIAARVLPITERLCALADLPLPRLAVMPTDIPNAFSAGRAPSRGVVVVTEGLLHDLDDAELEAVIAHELSHIANRDAFVMTIAAAPTMLGRKLLWGLARLPFTAEGPVKKIVAAIVLLYCLPLMFMGWVVYAFATLLVMSITRYREFVADRGAAILSGAPERLMSALQKIAEAMPLIPERDLRAASGMNALFVVPARQEGDSLEIDPLRIFPTHPPLERRLDRLAALARDLGRSRGVDTAAGPVTVDVPERARPANPHALAAFYVAVVVWAITAAVVVSGADPFEGMLWLSLLCAAGLAAGIFLGFQGVGRASAGAEGMGYAVTGLALLLGPWVVAFAAVLVFMVLAAFGVGPIR